MLGQLFSVLRTLRHRPQFEDAMAEEMRFHIEQYTADLVSSGVPPAEAARRARLEFGSLDNAKTDCREASGLRLFDELHQDLRYAVRLMRKTPGFTITALATLALCIGANLTIFAVVDSVLLRPLPFPAAGRLMSVYNTYPKAGVPNDGCSLPNYYERRGHIAAFSGLAVYRDAMAVVGETGATEQIPVSRVSPDFFSTLGLGPVMGRAFTEAETVAGEKRRGHPHGQLLAAAPGRRPARARPQDPRQRHLPDRGRGLAAQLQLPLVPGADLPPARVEPGRARAPAAALRDRPHDRPAPAGGHSGGRPRRRSTPATPPWRWTARRRG